MNLSHHFLNLLILAQEGGAAPDGAPAGNGPPKEDQLASDSGLLPARTDCSIRSISCLNPAAYWADFLSPKPLA
jgi:hypothetical protein